MVNAYGFNFRGDVSREYYFFPKNLAHFGPNEFYVFLNSYANE